MNCGNKNLYNSNIMRDQQRSMDLAQIECFRNGGFYCKTVFGDSSNPTGAPSHREVYEVAVSFIGEVENKTPKTEIEKSQIKRMLYLANEIKTDYLMFRDWA